MEVFSNEIEKPTAIHSRRYHPGSGNHFSKGGKNQTGCGGNGEGGEA